MRIYFSGPHGGGKSTLMQKIKESSPEFFFLYPEDTLSFPQVTENYFERLKSKLLRYYFEELDQQEYEQKNADNRKKEGGLKKNNPEKILLCSRCVYDSVAYSRAYLQLGWINQKEYQQLEKITQEVFDKLPERVVILNPSLETLQKQLQKRWTTGERKWNEENNAYLEAARIEFAGVYKRDITEKNILYLSDEPLEKKVEKTVEWVHTQTIKNVRKLNK